MNLKEIKVGETYNVRVKVTSTEKGLTEVEITAVVVDANEKKLSPDVIYFSESDIAAFSPVTPATAPKYDPCRLFKKGDKVRVVERDGRDYKDYDPYTNIQKSELYTVFENEEEVIDGGCVGIRIGKGDIEYEIPFYFLELVTPVDELEPYSLFDNKKLAVWTVLKNELIFAYYPYRINESDNVAHSKKEALAAAEAECARLNAEHRKEQE